MLVSRISSPYPTANHVAPPATKDEVSTVMLTTTKEIMIYLKLVRHKMLRIVRAPRYSTLVEKARAWATLDPNVETKEAVLSLVEAPTESATKTLSELFDGPRIAFGTAGLRARMGPGPKLMNDLTVLQATEGLLSYLEETLGEEEAHARGIVVGFDHRAAGSLSSESFAAIAVSAGVQRGFKVHRLARVVATPLVPFAVGQFGAAAGIMVTASHNPKEDNGYKVYWSNGAQIVAPHDAGIAACIERDVAAMEEATPYNYASAARAMLFNDGMGGGGAFGERDGNGSDVSDLVGDDYIATIASKQCSHREANVAQTVSEAMASQETEEERRTIAAKRITYTAMHGVGTEWVMRSFAEFGLPPPIVVDEQAYPDPDFPTVAFPNPEEAGALDIACEIAAKSGSPIVIASDPDADRLAVAVAHVPRGGEEGSAKGDLPEVDAIDALLACGAHGEESSEDWEWRLLKGDEIGSLLAHWSWTSLQPKLDEIEAQSGVRPPVTMLASTVSSKMLRAMGRIEGFAFEETLTGFKWLGNRSEEIRAEGGVVPLAYEEALGFCLGDTVKDKDGIAAASVFAEMVGALRRAPEGEPQTVLEQLEFLHQTYGRFVSSNGYVKGEALTSERTAEIFARLRTGGPSGGYWETCGAHAIDAVRDLTTVRTFSIQNVFFAYFSCFLFLRLLSCFCFTTGLRFERCG